MRIEYTQVCIHTEHTYNSSVRISNFSFFKGRNNDPFWNFVVLPLCHHL